MIAAAAGLSPPEVEEIESAVRTRVDSEAERKPRDWRGPALLCVLLTGVLALLFYANSRPEFPARYTVTPGAEGWLNSETRGCRTPFAEARGIALGKLPEGAEEAEVRGTFDEPSCRNYCWMDSGTQIEIYSRYDEFLLIRVVE